MGRNSLWGWVIAGLVGALVVGFAGWVMWAYMNADHLGVLDDPVVMKAADQACQRLRVEVDAASPPAGGGAAEIARSIPLQDTAIHGLVDQMTGLGQDRLAGDHPSLSWLDDWRTLMRLREDYARDLLAGRHPHLVLPRVDGIPITHRMTELADCDVVKELATLP